MTIESIDKHAPAPSASKRRARIWQILLQMIIGAVFGGGIGYLVVPKKHGGSAMPLWQVLLLPLAIIILGLVVIAVHEFGHFLGGKLAGMRFMLYIVGPLRIDSGTGRLRVTLNRSIQMAGGLCGMAPSDSRDLIRRMMILVAGGPIASIMLTIVGIVLYQTYTGPRDLTLTLAFLSGGIAVVTLLPMKTGSFYTDGSRLLMLSRGGEEAERWAAMAALTGMNQAGVRPREYDPELLTKVIGGTDESFDGVGAALIAYAWHLDRGEIDQAQRALTYAMTYRDCWPKTFHSYIFAEELYLNSIQRVRTPEQEKYLAHVKACQPVEKHTRLRAEAAVLSLEGRYEEAQSVVTEAEVALEKVPHVAPFERDLLARIPLG